jgi:hypothetical protein
VHGGAAWGRASGFDAEPVPHHGRRLSPALTLPPLGAVPLEPLVAGGRLACLDLRLIAGNRGMRVEGSRLRYLVAAVALERWGVATTALAREVSRRPEVVSRWAHRGAELRQTDPAFADAYDALDAALASETATLATSELEV